MSTPNVPDETDGIGQQGDPEPIVAPIPEEQS